MNPKRFSWDMTRWMWGIVVLVCAPVFVVQWLLTPFSRKWPKITRS